MPDYQQGKIYTIRCKTDINLVYVGSTINSLTRRWYNHKQDCNRRQSKINTTMKEIGIDYFYIELYELYPCNSKTELERREGEIQREIGTLNEKVAGRDKHQYYLDNLQTIREKQKLYYETNKEGLSKINKSYALNHKEEKQKYDKEYKEINKEKIKERRTAKIECPVCHFLITKDSQARHNKSKIHQDNFNILL